MSAAAQKQKDSAMAAHLKATGFPHGKRRSVTHAPPVPGKGEVGSAAYRRRVAAQKAEAEAGRRTHRQ